MARSGIDDIKLSWLNSWLVLSWLDLFIVVVEIVLKLDDSDTDLTILDGVLVNDPLLGLFLLELVELLVAWFVPVDTDEVVVEDKFTFFGFIPPCSALFLWLELIPVISDEFIEEIVSSMLKADFKFELDLLTLSEDDKSGSFMGLLLLLLSVAFVASRF